MNQTATIGHNRSQFDITTESIDDLYAEIKNWADGEALTTPEQHDTLIELMAQIRKAKTLCDKARKKEAEPHDKAKKSIQSRYNPFIQDKKGKVALALEVAQQILAPYLQEQSRLKQIADQQALEASHAAEQAAIEAMQDSKGDLEKREQAEVLVKQSKKSAAAVKKQMNTNVAKGARTVWTAKLTDSLVASRHYWPTHQIRFEDLIQQIANEQVRSGTRKIPGFEIIDSIKV